MRFRMALSRMAGSIFVVLAIERAIACGAQTPPQLNTASAGVKAADIEAAVSLICKPQDMQRNKDGKVDGCRKCPTGTGFRSDSASSWDLYAETSGHFTSAQADDLILDGTGCDSHADNFGGSFLFSIRSGKAKLLRYNPGLITEQCHKFAFADGRDYLICRGGWGGQGELDAYIFMATFDAAGKSASTTLLSVRDTMGECSDPNQTERQSDIKDIRFTPADSPQITGLTIAATLGQVRCSSATSPTKANSAQHDRKMKSYDVDFAFDGKCFHVTPASRAALNRLTPE
jgi:hypothetical protein